MKAFIDSTFVQNKKKQKNEIETDFYRTFYVGLGR